MGQNILLCQAQSPPSQRLRSPHRHHTVREMNTVPNGACHMYFKTTLHKGLCASMNLLIGHYPIFYIGNGSHVEVDMSCTHNCGDHVRPLVSGCFDTLKHISTPFHLHSFHFRAHADEGSSPSHAITVQGRDNSVDQQISYREISLYL